MNKPVVFFLDEDDDSRPSFRANLKRKGYHVSIAIDEEDALDRVKHRCLRVDLVLMNFVRKSPERVLEIGRNICRVGKLDVPIVVIAHKYGEDLEGKNIRVSDKLFIAYLEDAEQLYNLLWQLIPNATDEMLLVA